MNTASLALFLLTFSSFLLSTLFPPLFHSYSCLLLPHRLTCTFCLFFLPYIPLSSIPSHLTLFLPPLFLLATPLPSSFPSSSSTRFPSPLLCLLFLLAFFRLPPFLFVLSPLSFPSLHPFPPALFSSFLTLLSLHPSLLPLSSIPHILPTLYSCIPLLLLHPSFSPSPLLSIISPSFLLLHGSLFPSFLHDLSTFPPSYPTFQSFS